MTNMTKIEGAKLVAKMRRDGMTNPQITIATGKNRNWVSSRVKTARDMGLLPTKAEGSTREKITLVLDQRGCRRGSIQNTLGALDERELWWLLGQLPAGMLVAELLAAIVKDAYAEEMGE